jgi:CheY-like chemotaxis protein
MELRAQTVSEQYLNGRPAWPGSLLAKLNEIAVGSGGIIMRILIVEDQPDTRQMVGDALKEATFTVDSASDVESALASLGTSEYDAVILDWMLPDGSGLELCRLIRQEGLEVPVLFLTAKGGR